MAKGSKSGGCGGAGKSMPHSGSPGKGAKPMGPPAKGTNVTKIKPGRAGK